MNLEQMEKLLEAGNKPIDVAIMKWEQILEGSHRGDMATSCALCHIHHCVGYNSTCPLVKYFGEDGCGLFWSMHMTYKAKQCMLQLLYRTKELLIEDEEYI